MNAAPADPRDTLTVWERIYLFLAMRGPDTRRRGTVFNVVRGSSAVLALGLAACSPSDQRLSRQTLADAEAPIFSKAQLGSEHEIHSWSLHQEEDRATWRFEGLEAEASDLGWILGIEESGPDAVFALDVDLDAESVDVLELQVMGAPALGRVQLHWAVEGEGPVFEQGISENLGLLESGLRFAVGGDANWTGRIRRLEWRWSRIPDGQRLLVRGLRVLSFEPDPQRLTRALDGSWRVDIGRDVRPSLLALPGVRREVAVSVPGGGLFRCALGSTAPRPATTWILRAVDPLTSRSFDLLRERLEGENIATWSEREVDLGAFAGREIRLVLEIESQTPWKPGEGLPVWGGPEIITRDSPDERPNLILVSADTLRADHLSLYGYPRLTSPEIDRWARNHAVVFSRTIAPAPWTLPSHTSLFSGLDAHRHGVNYGTPAPADLLTLAETLRNAGYTTYAETGGGYLHPVYGLGQGFDIFRYPTSKVPGANDLEAAIERATAFVDSRPGPVFVFLHSYETHEPYSARQPHFERLTGHSPPGVSYSTEWIDPRLDEGYAHSRRFVGTDGTTLGDDHGPVIDLYDSRVANLDFQLGSLFSWSETHNDRRNSAIVVTSDHGESLGEDGRGGHVSLEEQLLHIPLILALPGGRGAGTTIEARVRLIDIAPTFYQLAGIDQPPNLDGESLLSTIDGAGDSRDAWSASPSTNAGVALEADPHWRFIRQASAWSENGLVRRIAIGEAAPPPEDPASIEQRIVQCLEDNAQGLEILFVHDGPESLHLDLAGSVIQNHRVKSWDVPPNRIRWRGQAKGVSISLEPGDRWHLIVFGFGSRRGDLVLRISDEVLMHIDLDAEQLPLTLEGDHEGWRRSSSATSPRTQVHIRWLGDVPPSLGGDAPVDDESRRQLEALGYVG